MGTVSTRPKEPAKGDWDMDAIRGTLGRKIADGLYAPGPKDECAAGSTFAPLGQPGLPVYQKVEDPKRGPCWKLLEGDESKCPAGVLPD